VQIWPKNPAFSNTSLRIPDIPDPVSIVIEESDLHSEKHFSPQTSTDAGITISTKPVAKNARHPIADNLDPDSIRPEESDLHLAKYSSASNCRQASNCRHTPKSDTSENLGVSQNGNVDRT
jgi:hypothetical protein